MASEQTTDEHVTDYVTDYVTESIETATMLAEIRSTGTIVMHMTILSVLMVVVVIGNTCLIGVVLSSSRLRTVTNAFIVSLAVSDLLVGLVVIPINFAVPTALFYGYTTCIYSASVTIVVCISSMANIFAVTVDRYVAVISPFKYHTVMTSRVAMVSLSCVWVYALVLGWLPVMGWRVETSHCNRGETYDPAYVILIFASGCILPVWGSGALYFRILATARRHSQQIRAMERQVSFGNGVGEDHHEKAAHSKNKSAFYTIMIMLVYFEVSWLPVFVSMLIDAFVSPLVVPAWGHTIFGILAFINSAIDPVIYGYRNREIRDRFMVLWRKAIGKDPNQIDA